MSEQKMGTLDPVLIGILFLVAGIIIVGLLLPSWLKPYMDAGAGLALTWLLVAILMLVMIGLIGLSLGKGLGGILIDPARNAMSLSRLQIVLWTWVILSAFVTVALGRAWDYRGDQAPYICEQAQPPGQQTEEGRECADPLAIQLPPLLWALMGISITSAVGSPLLKANKRQRTSDEERRRRVSYRKVLEEVARDRGLKPREVARLRNEGAIVKKAHWSEATFSDVFMGEEVSNYEYVDVAKVQNFFFTMISVVAYTVLLAVTMGVAKDIASFFAFPELPAGLIAVISISHAGYLTDKAFTHATPSAPLAITADFSANKYKITSGETVKLTWRVENAETVILDGQSQKPQGSKEVRPPSTKEYVLRAESPTSSVERQVEVKVEA